MNIVFTGVMDDIRDNETAKYEKFGICVQKTVTKKTDVLIRGYNPGNSKLDKAAKYGVKIMREEPFFDFLREDYPEFFL